MTGEKDHRKGTGMGGAGTRGAVRTVQEAPREQSVAGRERERSTEKKTEKRTGVLPA